jgi:hypothetical protein
MVVRAGNIVVGGSSVDGNSLPKSMKKIDDNEGSKDLRAKRVLQKSSAPQSQAVVITEPKERVKFLRAKSRPLQDQVETSSPAPRQAPSLPEHAAPQDYVDSEMLSEPRRQNEKNGFILRRSSKFHSDMLDDNN